MDFPGFVQGSFLFVHLGLSHCHQRSSEFPAQAESPGSSLSFAAPLDEALCRKIDSDPYFNGNELQRRLHKAIQKLPPKQRTVFLLRYFDELSYEDISRITGTSVGSLKASYHHAYVKIKEELEKYF